MKAHRLHRNRPRSRCVHHVARTGHCGAWQNLPPGRGPDSSPPKRVHISRSRSARAAGVDSEWLREYSYGASKEIPTISDRHIRQKPSATFRCRQKISIHGRGQGPWIQSTKTAGTYHTSTTIGTSIAPQRDASI